MRTFQELVDKAKSLPSLIVAVAAAADREVLEAVLRATKLQIAHFLLFGCSKSIKKISEEIGLSLQEIKVIHTSSDIESCQQAVCSVHEGKANVIMKGFVQTADFMRAILHKEEGLKEKKILSHVATFEVPGYDYFIHVTDPALNIAPTLIQKKEILDNVIHYCHSLGVKQPHIAILSAIEVINTHIPSTLDAAALTQMNRRGQIKGAIIDGPFALDNAISNEAAEHKKIKSPVAGRSEVLLVPDMESGNILYKSLVYFAHSKMGALVLGAKVPIILTSRADTAEAKCFSIALAVVQADYLKHQKGD